MENGITPVMNVGQGYNDGFGFGGGGLWLFAILALMWGGNGFFGNNNLGYRPATAEDVNNGFNFNDLQNQNRDIMNAITAGTAQSVAATNQAKYDNISVSKDIQVALTAELSRLESGQKDILARQNECCCSIQRALDGVNYNTTAQVQKVLDALSANTIEALRSRVGQLELAQATAGLVRYPSQTVYSAGYNPFYGPVPPFAPYNNI